MSGFLVNKSLLDPTVTQYSGGTASFTLPQSGATNATEVFVGGVPQVAGVDFNVSGTALTLTTSAPAGANMVCARQYFSDGITGTPASNSVATAAIQNDAIDSQHYVDGSIDLAHMSSQSVDEDNLHISNAGSNGQYLQKQSGDAGGMTWASVSAGFTQSAVTATTSGTDVTLTGIPSGTKAIYLMANAVSLTSHDSIDLTIGDSGGLETAGYHYVCKEITTGGSLTASAASPGAKWEVYMANSGTPYAMRGMGWIPLADASSFLYHFSYLGTRDSTIICTSGLKTLSAEITQISFSGGTFDNGSFSLLYI